MHVIFIDDTGTKEKEDTAADLFSYGGIIFDWNISRDIQGKISKIKRAYFNSDQVELKSRWFRMPELRLKKYLVPYGLSEDIFKRFSLELFTVIAKLPIHCLGSVVSKERMKQKYKKVVFDPSPVSYELLLQRVANYLTQYGIGDLRIMFDDMSGKNQRGSEWKNLLMQQHQRLKAGKSPMYRTWTSRPGMDYSRIPDSIAFDDSAVNTFLQLADLCAYNVMRQARDHRNFDGEQMYEGYKWIRSIMHRDPKTGTIGGFGAVLFP